MVSHGVGTPSCPGQVTVTAVGDHPTAMHSPPHPRQCRGPQLQLLTHLEKVPGHRCLQWHWTDSRGGLQCPQTVLRISRPLGAASPDRDWVQIRGTRVGKGCSTSDETAASPKSMQGYFFTFIYYLYESEFAVHDSHFLLGTWSEDIPHSHS